MTNNNGLYDVNKLSIKLRHKFLQEAIQNAYKIRCESVNKVGIRDINEDLCIRDIISQGLITDDCELIVVAEYFCYGGCISENQCKFKIILSFDKISLCILVNEKNFNKLITGFKLKLIN
jgi:hypothetical protein